MTLEETCVLRQPSEGSGLNSPPLKMPILLDMTRKVCACALTLIVMGNYSAFESCLAVLATITVGLKSPYAISMPKPELNFSVNQKNVCDSERIIG